MEEELLSRKKKKCQFWQSLAPCGEGQHGHCASLDLRMGINLNKKW